MQHGQATLLSASGYTEKRCKITINYPSSKIFWAFFHSNLLFIRFLADFPLPEFVAMPFACEGHLFEIERQGNHLRSRLVHRVRIRQHGLVLQFGRVVGVEHVAEAEHELQFRTEFEERQVEVAAHTYFKETFALLELNVVVRISREVQHGIHAEHHVGTVVVEALGREYQVAGRRDIHALHLLLLVYARTVFQLVGEVLEGEMARSEVHRGSDSEGKILVDARLAEYAHGESRVPVVLVAGNQFLCLTAVVGRDDLWSDIAELYVLEVRAHKHAEVERTQVGVRPVLHDSLLCLCREGGKQGEYKYDYFFSHHR